MAARDSGRGLENQRGHSRIAAGSRRFSINFSSRAGPKLTRGAGRGSAHVAVEFFTRDLAGDPFDLGGGEGYRW